MGDVLLVTGSRALCDTPAAEAWARGVLRGRITSSTRSVVAGDARGPDAWAHDETPLALWCARWCLDGSVLCRLNGNWREEARWLVRGVVRPTTHEAWAQRAIARNAAMVEHTARTPGARCLALVAPWSRTRGTQHTARLAREHGITVEVLVCPAEHGPGGRGRSVVDLVQSARRGLGGVR